MKGKVISDLGNIDALFGIGYDVHLQYLSRAGEDKSKASKIIMVKKHPCTMCLKSFPYASKLTIHMVLHTEEKLHKCAQCDKSFGLASNLKNHILTHSIKKLHKCAQCIK